MKDNKLSEILQKKNFLNFWYCFEFLLVAGYSQEEAINYSLNEFKEIHIFDDVAFIGMHKVKYTTLLGLDEIELVCRPSILKVGLFDDTNRNLKSMAEIYRKWLAADNSNVSQQLLEEIFTKIRFENLSEKTLKYFLSVSKKHYGFEAFFVIPPDKPRFSTPKIIQDTKPDVEELKRQMFELVGIPQHLLGFNTITKIR